MNMSQQPLPEVADVVKEFGESLTAPYRTEDLLKQLESQYPADKVLDKNSLIPLEHGEQTTAAFLKWQRCGLYLMQAGRVPDAIALFAKIYDLILEHPEPPPVSIARGSSLVWLSDCYRAIDQMSLAQRYLMLTVIDEAIGNKGDVYRHGGGYPRARFVFGISDSDLMAFCAETWTIYEKDKDSGRFPEWVLQNCRIEWKTTLPTAAEASQYVISRCYAQWLLSRLAGDETGSALEDLAKYLMSAIPGCRTSTKRSPSTDYDVVCALDGPADDFRRDVGRYVLCECKDWETPADFTAVAKFARVLESAKCRFGILFSRNGVTGDGKEPKAARRELLKLYHDTGIVVVVVSEEDLRNVVEGSNLVLLLRRKYEEVRLDLA